MTAPDPVEEWWTRLRAAALVGTARRDVPPPPPLAGLDLAPRPAASREEALLDAAALGDAVRRAGRLPRAAPEPEPPAPPETRKVAPPEAVQVLELLLVQGPVAAAARSRLVQHWLDTAAAAEAIVPPRLLAGVLELGEGNAGQALRQRLRAVVGERGRWLAIRNPAWQWVTNDDQAPTHRLEVIDAARRRSAAEGRQLIEDSWATDSAGERAAALAVLSVGLSLDDEPLLERALDDRASSVRDEARRLLDRLPTSARAGRMGARLRPLLTLVGTLRKRLEVALPEEPDPAAQRDGLTSAGHEGSRRARWLQVLVAGAPLEVWTDVAHAEPARVLSMLHEDDLRLLVGPLTTAAAGRGDQAWARALLGVQEDPRLLAVLPADERDRHLAARLGRARLTALTTDLAQAPRPWGPGVSRAVLNGISNQDDAGHAVRVLRDVLPTALDPASLPEVERLMAAVTDTFVRTALRDVLQFQSLHRAISEAFR